MRTSGAKTELLAVAGICALLLLAETRYGALSSLAGALSGALPTARGYLIAAGAALWIGMAVYSLRRRRELSRGIEAYKQLQSEFEASAITDKLTGLPNRHGLVVYLAAAAEQLSGDQDLALAGLHVSNLKMIANVQGFETAEAVITAVAERLACSVRAPDLVASLNGEHFYLLLHGAPPTLAARAATLLSGLIDGLRSVELPNGAKLPLSLYAGAAELSLCPRRATSPIAVEMLRRCDLALHEAEQRGAGAIAFFDKTMEKSIDRRGVIEASLDEAIRSGRIAAHFQPLVDLENGAVAGFEVLARWDHPVVGPIPPAVFVPIATESGRLEEMTLAIVDQACRAAKGWPGAFRLAINVSPKSLNSERFLADFLAAIDAAGFQTERIEVEITEDAFVQDAFLLAAPIAKLKAAGISLAIDDFGTGYSSLRHLQLLPFDKIKIDQSFVANMIDNHDSRKIVEAIIGLGRSMGLTTVAEGIEREDQLAAVRALGCKIGQGFIFAKALPADQAANYLRSQGRLAIVASGDGRPALAS